MYTLRLCFPIRLFLLAVILLLSLWSEAIATNGKCPTDNAVFDITLDDERYLEYLRYENRFDTATVSYSFGEVRLVHNGKEQRVLLAPFAGEFTARQGSSAQGIDALLLPLGRTENFRLSTGDGIKFYRELSAYVPCNTTSGGGGRNGGETGSWEDGYWQVGQHRVADRTEFVLEIVRASDDVVLGTLDSVGVQPNPATVWVPRYGTEPTLLNHERTLPAEVVDTTVYVRISPRRYGATPYGMLLNKFSSWVSLSTLFERTPEGTMRCSAMDFDSLEAHSFRYLIAYTDSMMLATGQLPFAGKRQHMTPAQRSFFKQRYLVFDTVVAGRQMYTVRDSLSFAIAYHASALLATGIRYTGQPNREKGILSITPNPLSGSIVEIRLHDRTPAASLVLTLYTVTGQKIRDVWSGFSSAAPIPCNVATLADGSYLFVLTTSDGIQIDSQRLVIQR